MMPKSIMLRRALALVLLFAPLAIVGYATIHPILSVLADQSETRDRQVRLLAGYERVAANRPQWEEDLRILQRREGSIAGLAAGATPMLAAANLQGDIKRIVEANHGEIRSAQTLASSTMGRFAKIQIRYEIAAPIRSLATMLYQIETHTPYLFLDDVDIHTTESGLTNAREPGDPKVAIRWTVHAYQLAGAK